MIKIPEISFQSKTAPAPARSVEPITTVTTETKGLFTSVLDESQESAIAASTINTTRGATQESASSVSSSVVNTGVMDSKLSSNSVLRESPKLATPVVSSTLSAEAIGPKELFNSVLGESQELESTEKVPSVLGIGSTNPKTFFNNSDLEEPQDSIPPMSSFLDDVETDLSDQKLIQLEDFEPFQSTEELTPSEKTKVLDPATKLFVSDIETDLSDQKLIQLEDFEPFQSTEELTPSEKTKVLDPAINLFASDIETDNTGVSMASIRLDDETQVMDAEQTELYSVQYQSLQSDDQNAIEMASRPVSLSEFRGLQPESQRARHSATLDTVAGARVGSVGDSIGDKAIDLDKLSIKQPYNDVVDFDEPVLVDKYEVDKNLLVNNAKTVSTEMKTESLLGFAKESAVVSDSNILKSVGHTPISLQSINGNLELSNVPSMAVKTGSVALPASTLALRQPGLDQSLASNISFMIDEDIQSASINVKPVELGPVNVQLAVRADHLSVTIAASQVQTRESLEATLPRLREQFAAMGFSSVDVNVGEHPSHKQSNESPLGNGGQRPSNGYLENGDVDNVDDVRYIAPSRVTHNGMLDTFA